MKYIKLLLIIFITHAALAQNPSKTVETKVVKATVFPEGAQVTRRGQSAIPAGKSELVFAGLSPYADPSSLQVEGTGPFTILSVSPQPNKLKEQTKRKEIEEIEKSKEGFNKQLIREQASLDVYVKEEHMLEANNKIGGQNVGLKAADLSAALDLHRTRLLELKSLEIDYKEKVKKIKDTLSRINAQIKVIKQTDNLSTTDVIVSIMAKEATSGDFSVSYVVKNAGWYPSYDLRVDDVTKPLTLNYKANVYQNTGEEWKDIKITFSNGNPNESGVAPVLKPLLLSNNNFSYTQTRYPINPNIKEISGKVTDKTGEPLIGASILVVGTTIGTTTDYNGNYKIQIPQGSSQIKINYIGMKSQTLNISSDKMNVRMEDNEKMMNEVVVTESNLEGEEMSRVQGVSLFKKKEKGRSYMNDDQNTNVKYSEEKPNATAVTFELATPYTVINDGKNRAVDMKQEDIPAGFEYFCVPKMDKSAYLIAHIANWMDYNLLEGEVNLYYEGTYMGKTLFSLSNAEDTLHLSLGHDKALSVTRNKVKEFNKRLVLSDKKTASTAFEIAVRNNKKFPINLVIEDQVPISTDKEITIENPLYEGAQLDGPTGKLTWKLNLDPAKEKKLKLSYTVKYPKSYRVQID
jgi:hypothetical protein